MIEHEPAGGGHAYRDEIQRRVPFHPVAGESFRVGAKASDDIDAVAVEVSVTTADGGVRIARVEASWIERLEAADAGAA